MVSCTIVILVIAVGGFYCLHPENLVRTEDVVLVWKCDFVSSNGHVRKRKGLSRKLVPAEALTLCN